MLHRHWRRTIWRLHRRWRRWPQRLPRVAWDMPGWLASAPAIEPLHRFRGLAEACIRLIEALMQGSRTSRSPWSAWHGRHGGAGSRGAPARAGGGQLGCCAGLRRLASRMDWREINQHRTGWTPAGPAQLAEVLVPQMIGPGCPRVWKSPPTAWAVNPVHLPAGAGMHRHL